jgi:hypothetical protein
MASDLGDHETGSCRPAGQRFFTPTGSTRRTRTKSPATFQAGIEPALSRRWAEVVFLVSGVGLVSNRSCIFRESAMLLCLDKTHRRVEGGIITSRRFSSAAVAGIIMPTKLSTIEVDMSTLEDALKQAEETLDEKHYASSLPVKRDLDRLEDRIEFVGSPRSGYYQLRTPRDPNQ